MNNFTDSTVTDTEQDEALSEAAFAQQQWNMRFAVTAGASLISCGIGTALAFAHPFAGATIVGVSLITSTMSYWIPSPANARVTPSPPFDASVQTMPFDQSTHHAIFSSSQPNVERLTISETVETDTRTA